MRAWEWKKWVPRIRSCGDRDLLGIHWIYCRYIFSIFLFFFFWQYETFRPVEPMHPWPSGSASGPLPKNSHLIGLKAWTYGHDVKYVVSVHYDLNAYLQLECCDLQKSPGLTDSTPIFCISRVREFFVYFFLTKMGGLHARQQSNGRWKPTSDPRLRCWWRR